MSYTVSSTATTNTNPTTSSTSSSSGTSSTSSDASTLDGNFSTFLTLLTAQIQNQDPTSPMDTTAWTNQLVEYSSVEQQLKGNQYLSTIASNSGNNMSSAVDYIGKSITATSSSSALSNGSANWNYNLAGTASKVALQVTDSSGNIVYSGTGDTTAGNNSFSWNGTTASGTKLTSGNYTLSVTATDGSGNSIASTVGVTGTVTAVQTDTSGDVSLLIGNTEVPISDVTSVTTAN